MNHRFASSALPALIGALASAAVFAVFALAGAFDSDDGGKTTTVAAGTPISQGSSTGSVDVEAVYNRARDAVVFIEARGEGSGQNASGSGFLIDRNGSIVTNEHVIEGAKTVRVRFGEQGDPVNASVKGEDPSSDLALLDVDSNDIPKDAKALELSRSDSVKVGEPAVAIGSPFGLQGSVTSGIVSALERDIKAPNGFTISKVIQTDAAINPGNSGGPLLDGNGDVIGVNAQIASDGTRANSGVGFAIPVDTVSKIVPQLREGGEIKRAYLGVSSVAAGSLADELNLPVKRGALIESVVEGGPADDAGLRAGKRRTSLGIVAGGDIVVAIDGEQVDDSGELSQLIADHKPGDTVEIDFIRGEDRRTASVKLGERPEQVRSG